MQKFGVQMSGATKALADHIVGVSRDSKGKVVWELSCETPRCRGIVLLRDVKRTNQRKCKDCSFFRIFGEYRVSEKLRPFADRIVAHSLEKTERRRHNVFWMRCETHGCINIFRCADFLRRGFLRCSHCRSNGRYLFGVNVLSDKIWSIKEQVLGVEKCYAAKERRFLIRCMTDGCDEVIHLRPALIGSNQCCSKCYHKKKKKRPFEAIFTMGVAEAKRRGKKFTLTYEDFLSICRMPKCFYCEVDLGRLPYGPVGSRQSCTKLLDRVDSSLGYLPSNVVPCCERCNSIKSQDKSGEQMILLMAGKNVLSHRANLLAEGKTWRDIYADWKIEWAV